MIKQGLPPVSDESTLVLILGSFPGEQSLERRQYYANRGNDFWKLIGHAIDENIITLDYPEKIKRIQAHGIGLWDVYKQCEREGSMDKHIKKPIRNVFSTIRFQFPQIKTIFLNGKTLGIHEAYLQSSGFKTKVLLSSSSANRNQSPKRKSEWKSIFNNLCCNDY